jgi:hypothetical protein
VHRTNTLAVQTGDLETTWKPSKCI